MPLHARIIRRWSICKLPLSWGANQLRFRLVQRRRLTWTILRHVLHNGQKRVGIVECFVSDGHGLPLVFLDVVPMGPRWRSGSCGRLSSLVRPCHGRVQRVGCRQRKRPPGMRAAWMRRKRRARPRAGCPGRRGNCKPRRPPLPRRRLAARR